jgi:ABC-type Fe3+ transport system substrate-binding protein
VNSAAFARAVCTLCLVFVIACQPASQTPQGSQSSTGDPWQQVLAAAKGEEQLLVYAQAFTGNDAAKIAEDFRARTGVNMDFISAAGNVLIQRYQTETQAGQRSGDIIEGSPQFLTAARLQGIFTPLKDKPLPFLKEPAEVWRVPPSFLGEEMDALVSRPGKSEGHITVNTRLMSPAEYPISYQELATNPKFKGKVAFNDPKATGNVAAVFVRQGYVGKSLTLKDMWSLFSEQQVATFGRPGEQEGAVARGEASIAIGVGSERLLGLAEANAPFKLLAFPDTPMVGFPQMMGVTRTASSPNSALVFINWYYSKEGQEFVKKLIGSDDGPRRDVPSYVPDALKAEVVGGGKRGPNMVTSAAQALLGSDLYASGIFQELTDGISFADFERKATTFIADWESKRGGRPGGDVVMQ